jgi:hypothetical protein
LTDPESKFYIAKLTDSKRKKIMDETHNCIVIQKQIKDEEYERKILQYVAPYFNFNNFKSDDGKINFDDYSEFTENNDNESKKGEKPKKINKKVIKQLELEEDSDSEESDLVSDLVVIKSLSETSSSLSSGSPIYKYSGKQPHDFRDDMKKERLEKENKPIKKIKK